ncbi:ribonuclease MC-like [Momordica charantia]|uniref:Ribonuclease MC-like n=1 Tax=Momordica charantia TaxID=3673 RepID=A0A6J1E145_MOMCH|nr:ribonuclease MC-like [Momordica charantia]
MAQTLFLLFKLIFTISLVSSIGVEGYDYFLMVQQWGPSTCACVRCYAQPLPMFTIHGLWPGNNNSPHPLINCSGTPFKPTQIPTAQRQQLLTYWPNVEDGNHQWFWGNEWLKHGKCSDPPFNQTAYFQTALNIRTNHNYDLLAILNAAGLGPTGTGFRNYTAIEGAIHAATNRTPFLRCDVNAHTRRYQLYEIVLCFDRNGVTLINCNRNNTRALRKRCPNQFVWLTRNPLSLGVAFWELKDSLIYHLSLSKLLLTFVALSTAFAFVCWKRFFQGGRSKKD